MIINFDQNFVQSFRQNEIKAKENNTEFSVNIDGKTPTLKEFVPITSYCIFDFSRTLREITGSIDKLSKCIEKNTEALEKLNNLHTQVQDLDSHVQDLDSKVQDLEPKVEGLQILVGQQKETISNQQEEIIELRNRMMKIEQNSSRIDEERLDLERYSRSFNLRVSGIKEEPNEKPETSIKKVKEVIKKVTGIEAGIEFGHRIGKKSEGVSRTIIFKLYSRLVVNAILEKRKDFFMAKYPLHRDLPKIDLNNKLKYAALMQQKYENKDKVAFVRGHWFVNGQKFIPPQDV